MNISNAWKYDKKPRTFIKVDPVELPCGWRLITLGLEHDDFTRRHGTVDVRGPILRGDDTDRWAFAFDLEKCSETPSLDGERVSAEIVEHYNVCLRENTPITNVCGAIYYWDEGLPGELLDLRTQCFIAH